MADSSPVTQINVHPQGDGHAEKEPIATDQNVRQRVEEVVNRIRPAVQADGGDVELVDVIDRKVVHIRLTGACVGCPSSAMTLSMLIERNVRAMVPEIESVEQVV